MYATVLNGNEIENGVETKRRVMYDSHAGRYV